MEETASDALWMSILAGLGAAVVDGILLVSLYWFDPAAKSIMENHSSSFLISFPIIFVAGFGLSLQFALEMQILRRKWK